MSPSSYIRRLHRELEGGAGSRHRGYSSTGQYRFGADGYVHRSAPLPPPAGAPGADPFDPFFGMFPPAPSPFNGDAGGVRRARGNRGRGPSLAVRDDAGLTMETALEIDESDDDDDDVVEVIDVEALI
ncbi:hypothetical protein ACHAW5_009696 [Stephanodiscus triporus]|uniref:Uncharacterized protein n=1 Tax=Stephanodiscus triporus TaxID=2934178 RepID=A0ABD3QF27_9STRA